MRIVVVEKPQPFVTLAQAKQHLRVDADNHDEDELIEGLVEAVVEMIEAPRGWLGRFLGAQLVEVRFDSFGLDRGLRLPLGDVCALESVRYVDGGGVERLFPAEAYGVTGDLIWLRPTWAWPALGTEPESLRIQYRAGFGRLDNGAWVSAVPEPIRVAVLMAMGAFYRKRDDDFELPKAAELLLNPFRVWSL